MKLLVVLALVGLVYGDAKPQWLLPSLVTAKTAQVGETPASTYTATYGHAALPLVYSHPLSYPLTYSHGILPYYHPYGLPLVTAAAVPAEEDSGVVSERKKRSADAEPEPEADPQLLLSAGLHYPAAVTSYASPITYKLPTTYSLPSYTLPTTYGSYSYAHGLYPYSGLYSGLGFPFHYSLVAAAAAPAEEEAAVESARKKRSAEPEAEPVPEPEADPATLLYSAGLPYTYPLSYHAPLAYNAPLTYSAPLTYRAPLTYSTLTHSAYAYPLGYSVGK